MAVLLLDGLKAFWEMEEATGATRLDSINGYDLTDAGTVFRVPGLLGNCADFLGSDSLSYLAATTGDDFDIDDGRSFTLATWVNLDSASSGQGIFTKDAGVGGADNSPQINLGNNGGNAEFVIAVRNAADTAFHVRFASTFGTPSTGAWILVVAWLDVDADTLNIQINNGPVDSLSLSGGGVRDVDNLPVRFARLAGGNHLNGQVDHSGWWRRVLNAEERTAFYNGGSGLPLLSFVGTTDDDGPEADPCREPLVVVELEQDQCRLIYGESPCAAALGTTGVRKCYNTRETCQDPTNYDSSPTVQDATLLWDIGRASLVGSFDISSEEVDPQGLFFKGDGTKLYIVGNTDKVRQFPVSKPWDISTAGIIEESFDVSGEETITTGMFIKPDGLKLYIVGSVSKKVHQYPLSTAWDLSSVGAVEASFDVSGEDTDPREVFFKSDGLKLYVTGFSSDKIHQYPLSTAWDVSSAGSVEASFDVSGEETSPNAVVFKSDGLKLYVTGLSDKVYQYPLSAAWDVSSAGAVEASFDVSVEETAPTGLFFKPDGTTFYIIGRDSDNVRQYQVESVVAKDAVLKAWELSSVGAVEAAFDVSGEETAPSAVFFKPDGTKLYIVGTTSDNVRQYPLSTAWDVSSAGAVEASFDVSPEEAAPEGLFFKSDGTKLYVVGGGSDNVRQYPLSTPWDISTAGAVEASFDVSTEEGAPSGLFFKPDGLKLYVVGFGADDVHQWPLGTAWDISTVGSVEADFDVSGQETAPRGVFFKSDGSKLYVIGSDADKIHQYPLATAWDVSTAGFVEKSFDVSGEDDSPQGLFFKPDGTKLYVVGSTNDEVHQYPVAEESGNDGIIDGADHVRSDIFGFSQALSFDGIDDSVEIPDVGDNYGFPGTAAFTVEFILNATTIPQSFAWIASKQFTDGSGDQGWRIRLRRSDNAILFERLLNGAADTVSATVTLGKARMWSAVYDGTDLILYEDGTEKGRQASSKSITTSSQPLIVGNDSVGGTTEPYHGKIDDVRIWDVARTETQIRERMVLPLSGLEADLVSYFPLDDDPLGVATRTLRFTKPQVSAPRDLYLVPLLANVDTAPTRLNPGGGSRDRGPLGERASVDATFKDAPGSDRVVDKYRAQRIDGTAQTDEGGYQPLDRGSFWSKWRARNPYFQNRRLRVLEGYVGQEIEDMQRREYFIDRLMGPDSDGRTAIRAKDVLRLADDERAQAPPATPGELTASLTDSETTSFQATGALIADYPDEPGLVRIGDEVIEYETRTQATPDNVQFNTLTRGARGSTADSHDAEDRVQRCLEFVSRRPWELARDLLVDFGNVPTDFIPIDDWDAEGEVWLAQFTLTAVITEPTSVTELLAEITQQAQFFVWWDEHAQVIRLKAHRPPTEEPLVLNDDFHIIESGTSLAEHPDQRISQVWVWFGQKDPTEDLDNEGNFARVRIRADLEAEGAQQYGESRIRKVFSRWLETEGQVLQVTKRTLDRYRDNPRTLRLRIDAKDRAAARVGELVDVTTRTVVDERGVDASERWLIVAAREEPAGEAVVLDLLESEFTGRFAFYMESDAPVFASASDEEKRSGAFYARDDGTMPDNSDGYQYQ